MKENRIFFLLGLSAVFAVTVLGCSVHTSKSSDDKTKDVDIRSPFGSLSVHEGSVDAKDIGLPVYPGAKPVTGHDDDDDGNSDNANVNISSPFFGVKVLVQKFETADPPDKVLDFYQKPMGKYGKVIQCSGNGHRYGHYHHGGNEPVSCDDTGGNGKELKVGTENNQHIVEVETRGAGSEFRLVYVRTKESSSKDTI
jgi:hypothetical protein